MSVTSTRPISFVISECFSVFRERLFPGGNTTDRFCEVLKDLPDHLLLDIGVDPRDVPNRNSQEILHHNLLHGGRATTAFRTVAKS